MRQSVLDAIVRKIKKGEKQMKKQNQEKENKDEAQQMLSWFQILMLIGRPINIRI